MRHFGYMNKQKKGQQAIEYILLSIVVVVLVIAFISKSGRGSYREALNSNLKAIGTLIDVKRGEIP